MKNYGNVGAVLLVNKARGLTSFDVIARLRRTLKIKCIGHTGTLDRFATGLLVILIGSYTRLCNYITAQDKCYRAHVYFGTGTSTDDLEGEVICHGDPTFIQEEQIRQALMTFLGTQQQIPPQFSAISIGGERAYKKARRGEVVFFSARPVVIHGIKLISWQNPCAYIEIHCSKGTYIRSIARDLGDLLSVPAHLNQLHRLFSGSYHVQDSISSYDLGDLEKVSSHLKTGIDAILDIPKIEINEEAALAFNTLPR
jgi:tRNA pseudouridine55 synthase